LSVGLPSTWVTHRREGKKLGPEEERTAKEAEAELNLQNTSSGQFRKLL